MTEPTLHLPGEGENFATGGSSFSLKVTSESTDGGLFLVETVVEPGFAGPPLHIHHTLTDMFYVLEGVLTFRIGDDTVEGPPGTFVCAPPGVRHTFSNPSSEPARFLNFSVPGGFETYIRELAQAWSENGSPPDPARVGEIASRHDVEVV